MILLDNNRSTFFCSLSLTDLYLNYSEHTFTLRLDLFAYFTLIKLIIQISEYMNNNLSCEANDLEV